MSEFTIWLDRPPIIFPGAASIWAILILCALFISNYGDVIWMAPALTGSGEIFPSPLITVLADVEGCGFFFGTNFPRMFWVKTCLDIFFFAMCWGGLLVCSDVTVTCDYIDLKFYFLPIPSLILDFPSRVGVCGWSLSSVPFFITMPAKEITDFLVFNFDLKLVPPGLASLPVFFSL